MHKIKQADAIGGWWCLTADPNPDKPEPKRGKTLPLCHETINGKIQRKDIIWSVLL
jgi:hypothetical protein